MCPQASHLLEEERALVQQLREQLDMVTSRADTAEQQVQQHKELGEELLKLRAEAATLLTTQHETEQQHKALQEQHAR